MTEHIFTDSDGDTYRVEVDKHNPTLMYLSVDHSGIYRIPIRTDSAGAISNLLIEAVLEAVGG